MGDARRAAIHIGWRGHLTIGAPVTALSLLLLWGWMRWLGWRFEAAAPVVQATRQPPASQDKHPPFGTGPQRKIVANAARRLAGANA